MGDGSVWPATRPSLLLQLKDGAAQEAWKTFVATYAPLLYRFCRRKGLQDADAQDVTQEVMAKVRRFTYQPERGHFRGWLATVTRREIARLLKKGDRPDRAAGGDDAAAALGQVVDTGDTTDWDRLFNAHVLEQALQRIASEFSEQEWRAFAAVALRVVPGEGGNEVVWVTEPAPARVAQELQQTVGWVYKVKCAMIRRLKEEILYLAEDVGLFA